MFSVPGETSRNRADLLQAVMEQKKWEGFTDLGQEYGVHWGNQGNATPRLLKTNAIQDFDTRPPWFSFLSSGSRFQSNLGGESLSDIDFRTHWQQ